MITIKHTHGITETAADLDSALEIVRSVYGKEAVVYGADGGPIVSGDDETVFTYGRALVWQDEKSSILDDGARAVASLGWLGWGPDSKLGDLPGGGNIYERKR